MFKKIFISLFSTLILITPITVSAQNDNSDTFEPTCVDIRNEAVQICNDCQFMGLKETVKLAPYYSENQVKEFIPPFTKTEYLCQDIIPLTSASNGQSLFDSGPVINCLNVEQTRCSSNNTQKKFPELIPSDSEFFNVSETLTVEGQSGSFIAAVEANGPILGPILLIINFLTGIIATLAILALVIGGFFMVTARGEESQITRGKDIVKNSLLAIVIVLGSYTLIRTIQATILLILN